MSATPANLDAIDRRLLSLLQADASRPVGELAAAVGLSQSPCWRRIQRLREDGFITGEVALLDRERLGLGSVIYAQLEVARLGPDDHAAFAETIAAVPEIVECHAVLGGSSMLVKLVTPDLASAWARLNDTVLRLPGVERMHTLVVAETLKQTTALPLGDD
jgi:Lrp/AsnC family transcriptional regulator